MVSGDRRSAEFVKRFASNVLRMNGGHPRVAGKVVDVEGEEVFEATDVHERDEPGIVYLDA